MTGCVISTRFPFQSPSSATFVTVKFAAILTLSFLPPDSHREFDAAAIVPGESNWLVLYEGFLRAVGAARRGNE
jgi:hypothetical protein